MIHRRVFYGVVTRYFWAEILSQTPLFRFCKERNDVNGNEDKDHLSHCLLTRAQHFINASSLLHLRNQEVSNPSQDHSFHSLSSRGTILRLAANLRSKSNLF